MTETHQLNIVAYVNCSRCIAEWKEDPNLNKAMALRNYARFSCGATARGFQVWCNRHECNVIHINFQGMQHPADISRSLTTEEQKSITIEQVLALIEIDPPKEIVVTPLQFTILCGQMNNKVRGYFTFDKYHHPDTIMGIPIKIKGE